MTAQYRVSRKLRALGARDPELQPYLDRLNALASPCGSDLTPALCASRASSRFAWRNGYFTLGELPICQTFFVNYRLSTTYGPAGLLNWRRESGDRSRAWFYEVFLDSPPPQIAHRLHHLGLEVSTLPVAQEALRDLLREKFAQLGVARSLNRIRAEKLFAELRVGLPEGAVFGGEGR